MQKAHFENILKASNDCIQKIDSIVPEIKLHEAEDESWAENVRNERKEIRTAYVASTINEAAGAAKRKAEAELDAMRAVFKKYMTAVTDPTALQSLEALVNAGVKLTPAEVDAYAATGDYAVLRLLEPHSKGKVKAPDLNAFETDMKEIALYFDGLTSYCGSSCELSAYVPASYFGLPPKTAGTIVAGKAAHLQTTLTGIADRWNVVRED